MYMIQIPPKEIVKAHLEELQTESSALPAQLENMIIAVTMGLQCKLYM